MSEWSARACRKPTFGEPWMDAEMQSTRTPLKTKTEARQERPAENEPMSKLEELQAKFDTARRIYNKKKKSNSATIEDEIQFVKIEHESMAAMRQYNKDQDTEAEMKCASAIRSCTGFIEQHSKKIGPTTEPSGSPTLAESKLDDEHVLARYEREKPLYRIMRQNDELSAREIREFKKLEDKAKSIMSKKQADDDLKTAIAMSREPSRRIASTRSSSRDSTVSHHGTIVCEEYAPPSQHRRRDNTPNTAPPALDASCLDSPTSSPTTSKKTSVHSHFSANPNSSHSINGKKEDEMSVGGALYYLDIDQKLNEIDPSKLPSILDHHEQVLSGRLTGKAISTIRRAIKASAQPSTPFDSPSHKYEPSTYVDQEDDDRDSLPGSRLTSPQSAVEPLHQEPLPSQQPAAQCLCGSFDDPHSCPFEAHWKSLARAIRDKRDRLEDHQAIRALQACSGDHEDDNEASLSSRPASRLEAIKSDTSSGSSQDDGVNSECKAIHSDSSALHDREFDVRAPDPNPRDLDTSPRSIWKWRNGVIKSQKEWEAYLSWKDQYFNGNFIKPQSNFQPATAKTESELSSSCAGSREPSQKQASTATQHSIWGIAPSPIPCSPQPSSGNGIDVESNLAWNEHFLNKGQQGPGVRSFDCTANYETDKQRWANNYEQSAQWRDMTGSAISGSTRKPDNDHRLAQAWTAAPRSDCYDGWRDANNDWSDAAALPGRRNNDRSNHWPRLGELNGITAAHYQGEIAMLQQQLHDKEAALEAFTHGTHNTETAALDVPQVKTQTPSSVSAIQGKGLHKEAQFLYQRLASGDLSADDRRKTIEILRIIEGEPSQAPPMSPVPKKAAATKSTIFNVSSSGNEHVSSSVAMDLKMHDLTKSITKMRAFDKFQRMQQDSDRLARIEEQLAKSQQEQKPKSSDKVASFQKRTAREVEKLNKKLDELLSKHSDKSEQAEQAKLDEVLDLKNTVADLRLRYNDSEENLGMLKQQAWGNQGRAEERGQNLAAATKGYGMSDYDFREYPSTSSGNRNATARPVTQVFDPSNEPWPPSPPPPPEVPVYRCFCTLCKWHFDGNSGNICPRCGQTESIYCPSWPKECRGPTECVGDKVNPRAQVQDSRVGSHSGSPRPSQWKEVECWGCYEQIHGRRLCQWHGDNGSWSEVSAPGRVNTVTSSVNEDCGPVKKYNTTKSSSPGVATPGSSWGNLSGTKPKSARAASVGSGGGWGIGGGNPNTWNKRDICDWNSNAKTSYRDGW